MAVRERFEQARRRFLPVALVTDGDGQTLAYPVDKGSGATTTLVDADGLVEVAPQTAYLDPGEAVTVELFSSDAQPPSLLGAGDGDPRLWDLLDQLDNPRYLSTGARTGARLLRDDVADVAVIAGPVEAPSDTVTLATWDREWGIAVPADNPADIGGLSGLVDADLTVGTLDSQWGLRASLDEAIEDLANQRGASAYEIQASLRMIETRSFESPAQRVALGDADVGVTLRETAERLDLAFVSIGTQSVGLVASPDRLEKPGVKALQNLVDVE